MTADAEEIWRAFLSHCRARPDGTWLLGHEYPAAHLAVFEQYGKDELERVGLIDDAGFPKWHDAYEAQLPVALSFVTNRAGEIVALRGTCRRRVSLMWLSCSWPGSRGGGRTACRRTRPAWKPTDYNSLHFSATGTRLRCNHRRMRRKQACVGFCAPRSWSRSF
jgi:hypothetical protein